MCILRTYVRTYVQKPYRVTYVRMLLATTNHVEQ